MQNVDQYFFMFIKSVGHDYVVTPKNPEKLSLRVNRPWPTFMQPTSCEKK